MDENEVSIEKWLTYENDQKVLVTVTYNNIAIGQAITDPSDGRPTLILLVSTAPSCILVALSLS